MKANLFFLLAGVLCFVFEDTFVRAVIRATITPASRIIQEQDNYTFVMTSDIADYGSNAVIQIGFPTDYDFSIQTTSTLAKVCSPISGIITSVLFDELVCSLDKESRILSVQLVYGTNNRQFSFTVQNLTNPTYSGLTATFSVLANDTSNSRTDTGGNNIFVTAIPGTLTAQLTSGNQTVGIKAALTINITQSHQIPSNGIITVSLPKWNPSSSNPISILTGTQIQCGTVSGFTTAKITCAFTQNLTSATAFDTLKITGDFSSSQTNIVFQVFGFLNPPSTTSYSGITITTSANDTTDQLDTGTNIALPITSPSPLASTNIAVTVPTESLKINTAGIYNFVITLGMPLTGGSRFTLTFPSTLTVSATPTVTAIGNLNAGMTTAFDSTSRVLTVTNAVAAGSNLDEGQSITFNVSTVTTPSNTKTTDSIVYQSYDSSGGSIEICDNGVTITATPGSIPTATATPVITTVNAVTEYTISFTAESIIPTGALLKLTLPVTLKTNNGTRSCVSVATNITQAASCVITNDREFLISGGFLADLAAGSAVTFNINQITNYGTNQTSAVFVLQTQTSAGDVIDSYSGTTMVVTATPSTFTEMNVTASELVTGKENTYRFDFNFTVDSVLANSILDVVFPSEIVVSNTDYSANTCRINTGILNSISCAFVETQKLRITQLFNDSRFLSRDFSIEIDDVKNPRSVLTSSSFQLLVLDQNLYSQKVLTTGKTVTANVPSDFQSISVVPISEANGAITNYSFSITTANAMSVGEFIRIIFPTNQITPSAANSRCGGVTFLATTLTCTVNGFEIIVTVATANGATSIPSGTLIEFFITNIQNPPTLQSTTSIQVIAFLDSGGTEYIISQRTTGLSITNSERGTISNANAVPDSTDLSALTNYTITFLPTNPLPQNSIVLVKIPEEIDVTNAAAVTCTSITYIASTLTCSYEPANRIVTITNGFAASTSYPASTISLKIGELTNPPNAVTTQSFTIETKDDNDISIDYVGTGVTYTKLCNSPCLTCLNDLSNCTSCYSSSSNPFLFNSTCVNSCPNGYFKDSDQSCQPCKSPCLTCENSASECLSCIKDPYKVLYGFSCLDSCPRFYTDDNQKCELLTESLIPFLFLIIWACFVLLLIFLKVMRSHTLFFSTLVGWTCFVLSFLWILVDIYLFAEEFTVTALIFMTSIVILYSINIIWCVSYYRSFIKKKDAFYFKYSQSFTKTEIFVHAFMYIFNFQMFRVALCRFCDFMAFSGSLHRHKMICRVMNIFTVVMIFLVLLPICGLNIYSMAALDLSRTSLFHHIECLTLTLILTIMLGAEIASGNKINTYDSFLLKSAYEKTMDQLDRVGNPLAKNRLHVAALKVLTSKFENRTDKELGTALAHYRYSELPSPTNEINLVTIEKSGKRKDPRIISSFPCSPKTSKMALARFQNQLDEANISLDDEPNNMRLRVPTRKLNPQTKAKEVRKKFKSGRPKIKNSYQDSEDESSKEVSDSQSLSKDVSLTRRAIRGAINAQSSEDESSRSTLRPLNRDDYKSSLVQPLSHLKLVKIKKEIYEKKNEADEIAEQNKIKGKEKKQLQAKLDKAKKELEDLMNSKDTYDTDSSGFVEQKAIQVTSVAHDLSKEESKQILESLMKNSTSSGVETDYIKKVNDRRLYNQARAGIIPVDSSISSSISRSRKMADSKDYSSTTNEFYGPSKPLPPNMIPAKIVSETVSDNPMTSMDAEGMGIIFPPTMETFKPIDLRLQNQDDYLRVHLPDINNPEESKTPLGNYGANRGVFHKNSTQHNSQKRGRKASSFIPRARKASNRNKTARSGGPGSRFPRINRSRGPETSRRDSNNRSLFRKSDLDITDSSLLEKAYKNILPNEEKMLQNDIEVRRSGRFISSGRPSFSKRKRQPKNFFKNRFHSIEPSNDDGSVSNASRLTPMERRKKWKSRNHRSRSKKGY
ncbi:unnamed protein product [Moneuplotes crassus]|uniref:Uncharacterized protein n=3 Tax=Euplotes crassus TaxID=5936 RepID=A0AAD1Y0E0_EUPCR|nr:unnamed protein product [Moneuplotes crassus]